MASSSSATGSGGSVEAARDGKFESLESTVLQGTEPDFMSLEPALENAPETIRRDMDEINLSNALRGIFELLREVTYAHLTLCTSC